MTAEQIKQMESELKPCSCGGRLYIHLYPNGRRKKKIVMHFAMKCGACGAWRGGFTVKSKRIYINMEEHA